jgi:hypothetical protein
MILLTFLTAVATIARQLMDFYGVFYIGFGCQCSTTDSLIPLTFLFAVAIIARELMV